MVIVDEPVRGTFTYREYPGVLTLPGPEQMRRFQRRELPYGPLWHLTGLDMVEFAVGSATFRLPCTGWLQSPAGVIPGGVLAFAADGALGGAIHSTLGPRRLLATSGLGLEFVRPPSPGCEAIDVRAQLIETGRAQALAEAAVEEPHGRLLARASARCMIIEVPGSLPDPPAGEILWPEYRAPHPFQRPPEGTILTQQLWDSRDGIEVLRAWAAGTLPRSPLANLVGAQLVRVEPGAVACTIPASPWLCGTSGVFYGGAVALLADYAMHGAVQSRLPAGTACATLDLKLRFLRPINPDGRPVTGQGRLVHQGRRIAVAAAEITTGDESGCARRCLGDAAAPSPLGRPRARDRRARRAGHGATRPVTWCAAGGGEGTACARRGGRDLRPVRRAPDGACAIGPGGACWTNRLFIVVCRGVMIMIRDRALRSLVVVGLVLLDAILALSLIGWLIMGVGMSTGGMNGFRMPMGLTVGVSVLAAVVFVAVIAAILWALRTPAGGGEPREPAGAARTGREDVP